MWRPLRLQQRRVRASLLSLIAGALLPLAFAPFEWFWLAPLVLALQFWLWQQASSMRESIWLGWLFGFGLFGVGASWVQVSVAQFGGINLPLSLLMALLFVMGMALFPALQGALLYWLRGHVGAVLWLFPLVWVGFEWLRSWFLSGFPWLLLGHTAPGTFYRGLAPWLGTLGVSLFIAWIALLLLQIVLRQQQRSAWMQLLLLLIVAWGSSQQQWGEDAGEPVSVVLVQGNIPQDQKWKPENLHSTLQRYREATEQSEARLVVWPETAIPAFRQQIDDVFLKPLAAELEAQQRTLISGIPLLEWEPKRYYNGVVAMGADQGEYHKRHLVPLGEFLPLASLLKPLLDFIQIPHSSFTHGAVVQPPLQVGTLLLSPTVCYEVAYPDLVFSHLPQAGALVTLSNDGWFGDSLAPYQHFQIARMRALESGRPLLRATNTGITALIGADGEVVAQLPRSELGMLEILLQPREGMTPYLYWSSMLF